MNRYTIQKNLDNVLTKTNFHQLGKLKVGKVRDNYFTEDRLIWVATDRQSAFDRVLASIPFKGQVLNQISAWWFEQTKDIVPNFILEVPDPNAVVGKRCQVFPFEMVVRAYLTGSTQTSVWTNYKQGVRNFCGNRLADGMVKNQKFELSILTPTTKFEKHDRNISADDIIKDKMASAEEWDYVSQKALELFKFGQEIAESHNLILVDTKYEFGKDKDGHILLIDEVHTPDSSRYWLADTYEQRIAEGKEPDNIDKEFLRLWFNDHCDPYNDKVLPEAPEDLVVELSSRYIKLYEMITGLEFKFEDRPILARIEENLRNKGYLV
ncbi:phosphoribosylaminoimidazolesuccinocarboxamide synthase [Patescibacteria group bacterium]|nr:phosphoribosylaminoimidazolesuccinocarboxamide synthase [Patescibacteria group bacterium]